MWEKKVNQCHPFKEKLIKFRSCLLVHNMESEDIWGFGSDGKDQMGKILMRVRDRLQQHTRSVSWSEIVKGTAKSPNAGSHGGARPKVCNMPVSSQHGTSAINANDKTYTREKPPAKTSVSNQNHRAGVDSRTNSVKKSTKPNVTVIGNSGPMPMESHLN